MAPRGGKQIGQSCGQNLGVLGCLVQALRGLQCRAAIAWVEKGNRAAFGSIFFHCRGVIAIDLVGLALYWSFQKSKPN